MEPLNNEEIVLNSRLEKISYVLVLMLTFLFPFFFIPSTSFPFELTKIVVGALLALVAVICYVGSRIREGSLTIISNPLAWSLLSIPVVFALSALFSNNRVESFIGVGYEIGTVSFMALCVLVAYLVPLLAKTKDKLLQLFAAFMLGAAIIALYHICRMIFGADFLTFGLLGTPTANFIGKWNDLASFFGLAALISFLCITFLRVNGFTRKLFYVAFIISIAIFAVMNFTLGWIALGVCALVVFLYQFLAKHSYSSEDSLESSKRPLSVLAIVVVILSLTFVFLGDKITAPISNMLKISQVEVRPSWGTTLEIAGKTLKESPIFGAGPNRFLGEFLKYKPATVNESVFWNTEFHYGVGLIPTFIVTTGLLGLLTWLLFLALYLRQGIKVLTSSEGDPISRYMLVSSFISSLFLWILAIFYVPSGVMLMLTFIFTGIFMGALIHSNRMEVRVYDSLRSTPRGVLVVYALIAFIVAGAAWTVIYAKQVVAGVHFQKSIRSLNAGGSIDEAELTIIDATKFAKNDLYYQSLIEIILIKINQLITTTTGANQEGAVKKLEQMLGAAISHAQEAVKIDSENYQNWISTGRIYETVVPLKVAGAYEAAQSAYNQAIALNPQNPRLYLLQARLEASNGKFKEAKDFIAKALELKGNYTEAVFLLSQIQVQEGNLKEAIRSVEAATQIAANDPTLFFQLGLLRYNDKNYLGTVEAMTKAVELNNQYSNARYFLGLSLARLGKTTEAIAQFEAIKDLNPENAEVETILQNLRAGRQPLANLEPEATKPETRTTPPVSDQKAPATKKSSI